VAEQASLALENSRLFQETQRALGESEALFQASAGLSAAQTYADVLDTLHQHTLLGQSDRCGITRFNRPWTAERRPESVELIAVRDTRDDPLLPIGTRFDLVLFPAIEQLGAENPSVIIQDVENDPRLDHQTRVAYLRALRARAVLLIPLSIGTIALGWIAALYEQPTTYTRNELRLLTSLAGQTAVTVQSIRLLEETRQQAERERVMADITARVRASTDVDTILRTAIRELGRALQVSDGMIKLDTSDGATSLANEVATANEPSISDGGSHD